jgi:integrase
VGSQPDRRLKLYRGSWYVVWRDGGTKRHSLRTSDRGQAERNLQEYLRQLERKGGSVSEILDMWIIEKSHLKSIEIAKAKAKPIRKFFGNLHPDQITRELCRSYRKLRKVSNTTVRNELSILRCAILWHDKHCKAVIELPPSDPPKDNYITVPEYKRLVAACRSPHMRLFVTLAWGTAARSGAILDLTWAKVDLERGRIDFNIGDHKNKKRTLVPMTRAVREALEEAYKARTSEYVIEFGGKQVKRIVKGFRETAKRADLKLSPHDLRRSAAICMAESGVTMDEIAQFLGHSNPATTYKVYARFSPDYLRKAASALDV